MIDVEAVQDRISDLKLFLHVGDMLDAAEEMAELRCQPPAAFVSISREIATRSNRTGVHDQRIAMRVSVMFVLRSMRSPKRRADEVRRIREALIEQLSGWIPPGATTAFDYTGFRVIGIQRGFVWVEQTFDTEWRLRIVNGQPVES